jgi:hypothetical protein
MERETCETTTLNSKLFKENNLKTEERIWRKKLIIYFSIFCYIVTKIVFIWCNFKKCNLPRMKSDARTSSGEDLTLSSQESEVAVNL